MTSDQGTEDFELFQTNEIQTDCLYTGEIVAISEPGDCPKCAILINGKILTIEQLPKLISTHEGWKIDIRFHE